MNYSFTLSNFCEELDNIQKKNHDILIQSNLCKNLCISTLECLKDSIKKRRFLSSKKEINFFKNVKVVPMMYLISYSEIFKFELSIPKEGLRYQAKYLQRRIKKINKFFKKQSELLCYMEGGFTHYDKQYFTREYMYTTSFTNIRNSYYKDVLFNTSHDFIWAQLKGLKLFAKYLNVDEPVKVNHVRRTKVSIAN